MTIHLISAEFSSWIRRLDPASSEARNMFSQAVDEGRRQQGLKKKGFVPEKERKEQELKEWGTKTAAACDRSL